MAILLKTASVRVSSIQIMQIIVQNKSKSGWKSRYVWEVLVTGWGDEATLYRIETGYPSVCMSTLNKRDSRETHFGACTEITRCLV